MGQKAERKKRFLLQHPICCFCGGTTETKEIDHVPSRAFFRERKWPEGYKFPACSDCNRATAQDEQVAAILFRADGEYLTEPVQTEIKRLMQGAANNNFDVLREMIPTNRDRRRVIKKRGLDPKKYASRRDLPVLMIHKPLVRRCLERFGVKLFCALHYRHASRIIPPAGGVSLLWRTFEQIEAGAIPDSIFEIVTGGVTPRRGREGLSDQFNYRWEISVDGDMGMYVVKFRQTFVMIGAVHFDATMLPKEPGMRIFHPRRPSDVNAS